MTGVPLAIASTYGKPNPSYELGVAYTQDRRYREANSASEIPVKYFTPLTCGPGGPTIASVASGCRLRMSLSNHSSKRRPRLRPSDAPTNSIDGFVVLREFVRPKSAGSIPFGSSLLP